MYENSKKKRVIPKENMIQFMSSDITIRDSIVVIIPACHAGNPGSIPGLGVFYFNNEYCIINLGLSARLIVKLKNVYEYNNLFIKYLIFVIFVISILISYGL